MAALKGAAMEQRGQPGSSKGAMREHAEVSLFWLPVLGGGSTLKHTARGLLGTLVVKTNHPIV